MLRERFPVLVGSAVVDADLVAFTTARPEPQDMTTAAITGIVANGHGDPLAIAQALAAPVALVASPDRLEIWSVDDEGEHTRVESVRLSDGSSAADRYR